MPSVSVVVATYQRSLELSQLLESLRRQQFTDFDVHLVADGGFNVGSIVSQFPELDFHHYRTPGHVGAVAARNIVLRNLKAPFVTHLDDDDWVTPEHLASLVAGADSGDVRFCDVELVWTRTNGTVREVLRREPLAFRFDPQIQRQFLTVIPGSMLYRRSLHDKLGLFDEKFRDYYWDWDWMLRMLALGVDIKRVAKATVLYAVDADGGNHSSLTASMAAPLSRLRAKHGLGMVDVSNFWTMAEDERLQGLKEATEVVWDGLVPAAGTSNT